MGKEGSNRADKVVGVDNFSQKNYWVTVATLLMVAFMLFLSVQNAVDSDGFSTAERTIGGVVFGIGVLAVLAGMWLLRERRATPVAYTLIVVPVLFTGVVFYWFVIPTILATFIIIGLLSGGLGRELRQASTPPPVR